MILDTVANAWRTAPAVFSVASVRVSTPQAQFGLDDLTVLALAIRDRQDDYLFAVKANQPD